MAQEYINEHELTLMLSIGRNCRNFGEPVRELTEEARKIFDENLSAYFIALAESKGDKRNPKVQEHFKKALEASPNVEPNDKEVARIYELLLLLSRRCLRTFGRNSPVTESELGSLLFERWVRYRENFDPSKKSKISGLRVNSFAYLTQVCKNVIFEIFHKSRKETSTETLHPAALEDIEDESLLMELEECKSMIIKESEKCTDFAACLRNIQKKYEIDPDLIVKTILFFDLQPQIEDNIQKNKWDF